MKWARKTTTAVFGMLLFVLVFFADADAISGGETTLLGFTFRFDGVEYDPAADESTWHYTVTGPNVGGPAYKDLSHWIVALCVPHTVKEASGAWERLTKPDPHHGITGIKWDEEVSKTGSRSFYFVLEGNWDVVESVVVGAKAGPETAVGVLPGPACQVEVCSLDYSVTTQSHWRILKPGLYAAPAVRMELVGNSAVRLRFSDFYDPKYLGGWSVEPTIFVDYSLGVTLEEAEAFGWRTAHQFNGLEVAIPKAAVQKGVTTSVWMRVLVTNLHRSLEYAGAAA